MSFLSSLAAKILIPAILFVGIGIGFFIGNIDSDQPLEANLASTVGGAATTTAVEKIDPVEIETVIAPKALEESAPAKKQTIPPPSKPLPPPPPASVPTPDAPFAFDQKWRDAVVNLYCQWPMGGGISSGSGVVIDPRGIILTSAHVAIDFLYYDTPKTSPSPVDCWVRTGSPSQNIYRAKLMYIPADYIAEDLKGVGRFIPEENIVYGKDDYGLLVITKTVDPKGTLPASFPYIPLDARSISIPGSHMYMIGYAASYLGSIAIMKGLPLMSSPVILDSVEPIKNGSTLDTLIFNGSVAGQHGSSGGAVVRTGGKLIAIPTYFKEEGPTTGESILGAITIDYVNRDMKIDTGVTLEEFIASDTPQALLQAFLTGKAPQYHKQYVDAYAKLNTKGTIFIVPGGY
ncbi:MAG: serine protease [Patescibacteria group bacterium]